MDVLQAILYGVVEGVTEFLPVSSTGHLILTSELLGKPHTEFLKSFEIAIQLGAILAVVFLYGKKLLKDMPTVLRVAVAFFPTAVIGLIAYPYIKKYLLGSPTIVLWSLVIGGIVIILFELFWKQSENPVKETSRISFKNAFAIGLFQCVAMIPGVSRSAASILGGMSLGVSRATVTEFSFLLALPTMAAATGLDLLKNASLFTSDQYLFLFVGFVVSFLIAIVAMRWLLKYVQSHNFVWFGVYRIIAGILFFLIVL